MTYYFGTDLANRVMQEDVTDMLEPAMNEIRNTLINIKSLYLDGGYGYTSEQERKKFWSALYAMTIDNLEYLINEIDKEDNISGVTADD
jgi:hypothetical protein